MSATSPTHPEHHEHQRVALLQQRFDDHVERVETFIQEQSAENKRIHDLIESSNQRVFDKVGELGKVMEGRGRISSSFIFGLIAIIVSLLTASAGVVHFYVTNQVSIVSAALSAQKEAFATHKLDNETKNLESSRKQENFLALLNEERLRFARESAEVRTKVDDIKEEISRLRTTKEQK